MANDFSRYLIGIRYMGHCYAGWEKNDGNLTPCISEKVINAIGKFCGIENYKNLKLSSRTDAGVHAMRNCFHVDIAPRKKNVDIQTKPYSSDVVRKGLNFFLSETKEKIFVTDVSLVDSTFDARASSTGRTYMYRIICPKRYSNMNNDTRIHMFHEGYAWIYRKPLNTELMSKAALHFQGIHDFTSFRHTRCQSKVPIREISQFNIHSCNSDNISDNFYSLPFMMVSLIHSLFYSFEINISYNCLNHNVMIRMMTHKL
jgi:tRNA pseudouridine38-40 synthase